ncbi:MAG: phosphoglycerate dehydrogenase [Bacteroidetes bacterium]|nr:MAG: phosphoglycerate dehydrogenase [Bacteroidota bacterium]
MKVAFLDAVHPILQTRLSENGFICSDKQKVSRQNIIQGQLCETEGIVLRSRLTIDSELLKCMPRLKWIARSGSGLENINLEEARNMGVKVYNSPEGNRDAVGEHVLGMLLMILHKLRSCDESVHEKVWDREKHRGTELSSKTVGIIGYGVMGTSFASKLAGLDCEIIAYDKYKTGFNSDLVKEVTEKRFFEQSDIVSIHVPWTDETKGLVNRIWLNKFSKPIILINSSRGAVVNTNDLLDAMDEGKVKSIALDVLEFEGRSLEGLDSYKNSAAKNTLKRLLNSPNVYLSPHVAGWTTESYVKLSTYLADKILKDFKKTS